MKKFIQASTDEWDVERVKYKIGMNEYVFKGQVNTVTGAMIGYITKITPYDDAEYVWANIKGNGLVEFIRFGKVIDKMQLDNYLDFEDEYETVSEYLDIEVRAIIDELHDYNKDIQPVMVYD